MRQSSTRQSGSNEESTGPSGRLPRVAYIVSRFPSVTETFVLNEMIELRRLGMDIEVYAFIRDLSLLRHPGVEHFIEDCGSVSIMSIECLRAQWYWMVRRPIAYARLWWETVAANLESPKFLARALLVVPKSASFAKRMVARDVDHVHAHFGTHAALAAFAVRRLAGIEYSVTIHAHDLYVNRTMLEQKLKAAQFVATISEFNQRMMHELYGDAIARKVSVVRCGVDTKKFQPRPAEAESEDKAEKTLSRLLCVGSLEAYKGHRFLVDACGLLAKKGIAFHCELIGDGELRPAIEDQIKQLGLEHAITLAGVKSADDVRSALGQADVFVLPSIVDKSAKMEGIPVALMEAMALGVPVVSTNISGIPELVADGVNGRLIPEKDTIELARVLQELLADPSQRERLAATGRQRVLDKFDLKSNVKALYGLISQSFQPKRDA